MQRTLLVAVVTSVALSSFACSVTPAGQDLFASASGTNPTPTPTPDPDPTCPAIAATCASNETRYANVTACTSAGEDRCRLVEDTCGASSFYCGSSKAQCLAIPTCDGGDKQVTTCPAGATCYQRSACGTTITCAEPEVNCAAVPACDAGDVQVTDVGQCNKVSCYSRTVCGTTIWCTDLS